MNLRELALHATTLCVGPEPSEAELALAGDPRIWRLYRELIRTRLRGEARAALPRSIELMGEPAFERGFERWLRESPPRSRAFYGVAIELAQFLSAHADALELSPVVRDLLRYESTQRLVTNLDDRVTMKVAELALDAEPVLNPTLRLLELGHGVHARKQPEGGYRVATTRLLIYRRQGETRARTSVLDSVSFGLFERLLGTPVTILDAVRELAQARRIRIDDKLLDRLCTVLADLHETGALLGSQRQSA